MKVNFFKTLDPTGCHTGEKNHFHRRPSSEIWIDYFPYGFAIERYCTLVISNKIACNF